jgi:cbb3-type cytochrome c oxidase subunit III
VRRPVALAAVVAALVAAGCGSEGIPESGSTSLGQQLFTEKCGSCHTLQAAGTKGQIGPNLDDAFARAREDGFDESTIAALVRNQIAYPVTEPGTGVPGMPADLVTGENADSVALYVASVAATGKQAMPAPGATTGGGGGGGGGAPDGKQVFESAGCTGCHTLADAGSTGNVGPNLDDAKPPKQLVVDRVTNGQGAMPAFKGQLSDAEIEAVADYVSSAAGT